MNDEIDPSQFPCNSESKKQSQKNYLPSMAFYLKQLKLDIASTTLIDHEDGIVDIVYKIVQLDGKELILKICGRDSDYLREIYFLKLFANTIPVPRIVKVIPPQEGIQGAILMECIPGELLKTNMMTEPLAYELGSNLALIHHKRLPRYGDPILNILSEDPRKYYTFKFEEGLAECKSHLPMYLIEACQDYFYSHIELLSKVDGPCVVHRDFRPGNLIFQNDKLQGIIDWAGARASFAEEDFSFIEHGNWLKQHLITFLSGYSSIRPVPEYKHLIPFLRMNKAVAIIGFTVKRETWEKRDKRIYQFNRKFLENLFMKS